MFDPVPVTRRALTPTPSPPQYVFLSPEDRQAVMAAPVYQRIVPQSYVYQAPINGLSGVQNIALPFSGPCSELLVRFSGVGATVPFTTMAVYTDRSPLIDAQPPSYYQQLAQRRHHHHPLPTDELSSTYLVSFALDNDAVVPDGHIDLGAFDLVELQIDFPAVLPEGATITVYSSSWNVFKIQSGMGGLLYSR